MEPLSVTQVLTAIRGSMVGRGDPSPFSGVSTDTRSLEPGDLFFALKGPHFDGHRFVSHARDRGARGAVISDEVTGIHSDDDFVLIRVADAGEALLDLARYYRSQFSLTVIAITGSNGKTTTKEIIGTVLDEFAPTIRSEKSFNNRIGLPLSLFRIQSDTKYAVVEIGTSAPGEIAELAAVARPDIAVITNVAESHLEGLGSIEGVLQEKATLMGGLKPGGKAVLNADDPRFPELAAQAPGPVVTFGFLQKVADYRATGVVCGLQSLQFSLGSQTIEVPLTGCHNVSNVLAALAVTGELGLSPGRVTLALGRIEGPPGRLRPIQTQDLLIIDDSYNANPGSMLAALDTFSILDVPGRRIAILGDMCELGSHSEALHRKVGRALYAGRFDQLIAIGQEMRFLVNEAMERGFAPEDIEHFESIDDAASFLPTMVRAGDAILLKGSRAVGLDRLVGVLEKADVGTSGWVGAAEPGGLKLRA